jgi:Tetracyclin repressor-like, C-terminal domain
MPVDSTRLVPNTASDRNAYRVRTGTVPIFFRTPHKSSHVRSAGVVQQGAGGNRRSSALASPGDGCRVSNVDWGSPQPRRGPLFRRAPLFRLPQSAVPATADRLFWELLANLHLHLEHEVDLDRIVEIRRTSAATEMSLGDAIEQALPAAGRTKRPSRRLPIGGPALWQIAHPPQRLIDAFAEESEVPPTETSISYPRSTNC